MEIVLATRNLHKIRELKAMLKELPKVEILSLLDFPNYVPPEETGTTFSENALLKAKSAAFFTKKWALADDSGLVVPALDGRPGIYSARYAHEKATDAENRAKLLQELQGKNGLQRNAYFECWLALCPPDETACKTMRGLCEGTITETARGKNGFGYDPLFLKHDYLQTFAELEESVKNRISHRRKALDQLRMYLESHSS